MEEDLAFATVKWGLDYAAEVALPCLTGDDGGEGGDACCLTTFSPRIRHICNT